MIGIRTKIRFRPRKLRSGVDGNLTKPSTSLNSGGIIFNDPEIDVSSMTHPRFDVFSPACTDFQVERVSLAAAFGRAKALTQVLSLDATTIPAFTPGSWVRRDIPL